jgi:hypothetical protein
MAETSLKQFRLWPLDEVACGLWMKRLWPLDEVACGLSLTATFGVSLTVALRPVRCPHPKKSTDTEQHAYEYTA